MAPVVIDDADRGTPQGAAAAVVLEGVRRDFGDGVVALDGIELSVRDGEFVAIVGPSGCGKSTLLRLVAGLEAPQAGTVRVVPAGIDRADGLAFVFQDAHLLPWRRVQSNVELPLELRRAGRQARRRRASEASEAIAQVGLQDAADRFPAQLSGGMRMRVSIARALVTRPSLLLLDEPFAALDEITRGRLDEQLHALWLQRRMTVLFVTHSVAEAVFLAQRVVVLTPRPARVAADVAVELSTPRTAELRTAPEFNAIVRRIQTALRDGDP